MIAVRFAAAAAKMHDYAKPAALHRRVDQSMGIRAVQTPFQTMKDDEARLVARLVRVFAPGEIDKIAVWQLKALPVRGKAQFTADQPRQHGLQMTIAHAAHGMELTRIVFGGRHVCGDDFNHSTRIINKRDDDYTAQGAQELANMWSCGQ